MKKLVVFALALCVLNAFAQEDVSFPVPPKKNKITKIHGYELTDPYFWMNKRDSIPVINHLYAENAYADSKMEDSKFLRLKLYEEMKSRMNLVESDLPTPRDGFYYYTRYDRGDNFFKVLRKKDTLNAKEELVFDFNSLSKDFQFFIPTVANVSPNHEWICYGIDNTGNRDNMLFFRRIGEDSSLSVHIPRASSMLWFPDNKHILYSISDSITKRVFQIYLYKIGEPLSTQKLIYQENNIEFEIGMYRTKSDKYIFINSGKTDTTEVYYLNATNINDKLTKLIDRKEGIEASIMHEKTGEFYVQTNKDHPNNSLYTMEGIETSSKWKKMVAAKEDTMLSGVIFTKDYMLITYLADAQYFVKLYFKNGKFIKDLAIKSELKSENVSNPYKESENRVRFSTNFNLYPSETYDFWIDSNKFVMIDKDTLNFKYNPKDYVAKRMYITARDGETIPVTVMYKANLDLTKTNPMFLTAYGSYGSTSTPGFSRSRLSYLDRGFIHVEAHIRGSSAKGDRWYKQGKMFNKKNTFNDFIDVAKWFQENNWTTPKLTAIEGGSAGGLLMGAVINDRPDLFGCVVANVPFVDVITTMLDDKIPLTTFEYHEWGNPNKKEQFDYMYSYSPIDNVKAQNYPPMLVTAGYNDSQVGYWEPAKWVAKLRETKTDTNHVLFKTNMKSGHGGSSGRYEGLKDAAYEMAFVLRTLGFTEDYVKISGRVFDENNSPFMFCNVVVKGTTNGTVTNDEGFFSLDIKKGQPLVLEFSSLGFEKKTVSLDPDKFSGLIDVKMKSTYQLLKEVVVSSKAKDPSYEVIKNAIKAKKDREKLIKSFENEIYIKNTTRLNKIPDKLPKFLKIADMPDSNDIGLMSLSESVAKFYFEKPEKVKEVMIASKQAGSSGGFNWNRASDVLLDFYANNVELLYYSDRPFLSPIATTALLNYDYKMISTFIDNGRTVNKIKISPKRKGDPLFQGHINIMDSTWDIHSLELIITQDAQIEYVDTVWISQEYVLVDNKVRMPLKLIMKSYIQIFGFKATDLSVGSFTNYKLNENYGKKFFSNQLFKMAENANKKDSVYWVENRGALLTDEENNYYYKADSLRKIRQSPAYLDSVMRKDNKISLGKILVSGYSYSRRRENISRSYSINSALGMFQFNPVQGFNPDIKLNLTKYNSETWKSANYTLLLNYGFADKVLNGGFKIKNFINRKNSATYTFEVGRFVNQLNRNNLVPTWFDTYGSLFFKENFSNLLREEKAEFTYSQELLNGLFGKINTSYSQVTPLVNNTQFSFFYKDRIYNEQQNNNVFFTPYNVSRFKLSFAYYHNLKYQDMGDLKLLSPSKKYPPVYFSYEKVMGVGSKFGSDLVEVGTGKNFDLKMLGSFSFDLNYGLFLTAENLQFPEFHHFNGNGIFLLHQNRDFSNLGLRNRTLMFEALDYYTLSTNKNFFQMHLKHNFKGFLLGKLPLVRKLKLNEIVGYNSLYTGNTQYHEFYVGLANILKFLRVDLASTYRSGSKLQPVVRVGLDF
jgi:oligopeptidase B